MARKHDLAPTSAELQRGSPLAVTIGLLIGFVVLAIVGVVTVVVPEVTDDGDEETQDAEGDRPADAPEGDAPAAPPAASAAP
ncbi:Hypothetical protein I5071_39200 [Sandaracinus amylolyticus]|nr:Hypothetical protein I5071_39200 [Sandaracinus amylolyticus]